MLKYISLLIISVLFLSSCWSEAPKNIEKSPSNTETKLETKKDNLKIESIWVKKSDGKLEIEYDEEEETLSIWSNVKIKKWLSNNLPEEIKIFWDNETYLNSNVSDYLFFVDNTSEWIGEISLFYTNLFEKTWYTRINNEIDENLEIDENIQEEILEKTVENLEYVLENEAYTEPKEWEVPNEETKYKQRILINMYDTTPENLEKGMWLKWNFVEIYYNQIWF